MIGTALCLCTSYSMQGATIATLGGFVLLALARIVFSVTDWFLSKPAGVPDNVAYGGGSLLKDGYLTAEQMHAQKHGTTARELDRLMQTDDFKNWAARAHTRMYVRPDWKNGEDVDDE